MVETRQLYTPLEMWCIGGLGLAFILAFIVSMILRVLRVPAARSKERERVKDYNYFIGVEQEWQAGRVSERQYQSVRLWFYAKHPNGDESY